MSNNVVLSNSNNNQYKCAISIALDVLGGKWKPLIIWHLKDNVLRFGELKRTLNGITHKILTQQLRELESDGLVKRKIYSQVPPKVEYSLTKHGYTVIPTLEMMSEWGTIHCIYENSINDKQE